MTAIDNTPENKNFLSPLNFRFQIKKAPNVNFFIQKVNVPQIELPQVDTPNPFVKTPYPGDHITYSTLNITFRVDEDLHNYLEIHNWIKALGKPDNYNQFYEIETKPTITGDGIYSDISLLVLNSTKLANFDIVFKDAFPIMLSDLTFNTTDPDVNYLPASATFKYTSYEISKII